MTPVVPSKGQDTGTDQWKISTINDTPNTMHLELSQGYVAGPEAIYYVPQEYMNGFGPSVFPEHVPNGEINNSNGNQEPESPQNEELSLLAKESVPLDELKRLVRHQFEYYFSRENLANDAYLGKC